MKPQRLPVQLEVRRRRTRPGGLVVHHPLGILGQLVARRVDGGKRRAENEVRERPPSSLGDHAPPERGDTVGGKALPLIVKAALQCAPDEGLELVVIERLEVRVETVLVRVLVAAHRLRRHRRQRPIELGHELSKHQHLGTAKRIGARRHVLDPA